MEFSTTITRRHHTRVVKAIQKPFYNHGYYGSKHTFRLVMTNKYRRTQEVKDRNSHLVMSGSRGEKNRKYYTKCPSIVPT
ncbi:MAG TPA: hypothetical protein PLR22_05480 [Saprospiraceae bacterium]|nr:hypothetical protein [Saprospiraceae bacterium]